MTTLTVKMPTSDQLRAVATELGFVNMGDADLQWSIRCRTSYPQCIPAHAGPALLGRGKPAWRRVCEGAIQGAPFVLLRGKAVAIKDNICPAGMPMMNGASTPEG